MNFEQILSNGDYKLIDVREPMELQMDGAIDSAENIPLGQIEDRKEEIINIEQPIIFFCRSGNRSGKATDYIKNNGKENVYNGGGYHELKDKI